MQTFIRQDSPPVWVRPESGGPVAPSAEVDKVDATHAALTGMLTDADRARRTGVGQCGP